MLDDFIENGVQDNAPERVILVDMSQVSIGTIMAVFKPEELTSFDEAMPLIRHLMFSVLLEKVDKFRKNKDTHHVVLCYDNSGDNGYWRRDLYTPYKANRKKSRTDSKYNFDIIYKAMDTVRDELVEFFPFASLSIERMEADDIIATLTKHYAPKGSEIIILSSDGDFVQLQDLGDVKQWSAQQKKWVLPKYGSPQADLRFKAIKGDKKDNVAPMKCEPDHYTNDESGKAPPVMKKQLDEWLDDPDTIPEEYQDRYNQNMAVLDLQNIPEEHHKTILEAYKNVDVASGKQLYSFMVKKQLSKLIEKIQRF